MIDWKTLKSLWRQNEYVEIGYLIEKQAILNHNNHFTPVIRKICPINWLKNKQNLKQIASKSELTLILLEHNLIFLLYCFTLFINDYFQIYFQQ